VPSPSQGGDYRPYAGLNTPAAVRCANRAPNRAARVLGVSEYFFTEHVAPELRCVRRGRLKLYSLHELLSDDLPDASFLDSLTATPNRCEPTSIEATIPVVAVRM
jgi:hypothetical protein